MENRCPQCNEPTLQDSQYKGVIIYMCTNRHRSGYIDQHGQNVPAFKLEGVSDESGN